MTSVEDFVRQLPDKCEYCGRGVYAPRISGFAHSGTIEVTCECTETLAEYDVESGCVKPSHRCFFEFEQTLADLEDGLQNVMTDDELLSMEHNLRQARNRLESWYGAPVVIGNPGFFEAVRDDEARQLERVFFHGKVIDFQALDERDLYAAKFYYHE